jgi:hypothetical protein
VAATGLAATGAVDEVAGAEDPEAADGGGAGDALAAESATGGADADSVADEHPAAAKATATAVTVIQILNLFMCSPGGT